MTFANRGKRRMSRGKFLVFLYKIDEESILSTNQALFYKNINGRSRNPEEGIIHVFVCKMITGRIAFNKGGAVFFICLGKPLSLCLAEN